MMLRNAAASNNWSLVSSVNSWCLAFQVALGQVGCGIDQRGAHVLEADAARGQRVRIDLHMHGRHLLAGDIDLRHAGHARQRLRQHVVGVLVDVLDRHRVGTDGVDQDRAVRRVGLLVGRRGGQVLRQQSARRVDRGLHVLGGAVDVAGQVELQRDRGRARARWSTSSAPGRGSRRTAARAASRPKPPWSAGWRRASVADDRRWSENRRSAARRPATA